MKRNLKIWLLCLIVMAVIFRLNCSPIEAYDLNFERYRMDNGVNLLFKYIPDSQVCSINIFVKVGSYDEEKQNNGISHLFEHIFFKTSSTIKSDLDNWGAMANGETNRDFTRFYLTLPSANALEGANLLLRSFFSSDYSPQDLKLEKTVVLNEMRMRGEEGGSQMRDRLYQLAFPFQGYGLPIIGNPGSVSSITQADLQNFKNHYYSGNRVFWIVTGNFPRQKMLDLLMSKMADLPAGGEVNQNDLVYRFPNQAKVINGVSPDWGFAMAFWAPPAREHKLVASLDLLYYLLGQGRQCCFNQSLPPGTGMIFLTQRHPGLLEIYTSNLKSDEIDKTRDKILEILYGIARKGVSASELMRAKALISTDFLSQQESCEGISSTLGFYEAIDEADFAKDYLKEIQKITSDDLARIAGLLLHNGYIMLVRRGVAPSEN